MKTKIFDESSNVYLSHFSALKEWEFPFVNEYYSGYFQSEKQEVLILDRSDRDRSIRNNCVVYLCTKFIPDKGLVRLNGMNIVSPYLIFLQLSENMDIIEIILLGNLLCSKVGDPHSENCVDLSKLKKFVNEAKGFKGRRKALRALKYIKNGSCSIMEVFLYLFLGLPVALGGLGLNNGIFNYEVILNSKNAKIMKMNKFFIDYYLPDIKLGYEYMGEVHNETIDYDSNRDMILKTMGYEIISISKTQLYNLNKFNIVLEHLMKVSQKRIRLDTPKYQKYRKRIHQLLPRRKQPEKTT